MDPIVLIHGYSAESKQATSAAIQKIYGTLPQALRDAYGNEGVIEIDLSRYLTLEDGLTIDDISRAFDRVLKAEFASLLMGKFHVIGRACGSKLATAVQSKTLADCQSHLSCRRELWKRLGSHRKRTIG
jgi:hypothetical protein